MNPIPMHMTTWLASSSQGAVTAASTAPTDRVPLPVVASAGPAPGAPLMTS